VSPIFIRPVREQLEHDRLIRHLLTQYKKFEITANVGDEQVSPVKIGTNTFYPDLVWTDGKRVIGIAEVETGESVNNLEAMAQWVHFSRARVPFHLYVPVQGYDAARRLCEAHGAKVTEVWTYRASLDSFDLVRMYADPAAEKLAAAKAAKAPPAPPAPPLKTDGPGPAKKAAPPAAKVPAKPSAKPVKSAPAKTVAAKPASKVAKSTKAPKPVKSAKPSKAAAKAKAPARKPASKPTAKKAVAKKKKSGASRGR
jgi:hypothetical protein